MKHTPSRGSWQDSRQAPLSYSRSSAVDPADLTLDSRVQCRICERATFAIGQMSSGGSLLRRETFPMLLTDARDAATSEEVVHSVTCRPCAIATGSPDRYRPLLDVLVHAFLTERRSGQRTPLLVRTMYATAAKEYKPSSDAATPEDIAGLVAGVLSPHESLVPDEVDTEEGDDPDNGEIQPWDRMVLAALPTIAARGRIGLPKWRVIGVVGE